MTGVLAQLGRFHGSASAGVLGAFVLIGLLVSAVAAPHAVAAMHASSAVASDPCDRAGAGGHAAPHHAPADAGEGHAAAAGEDAGAGDACGAAACCPGDLALGFEAPPRPHARADRVFGLNRTGPPAPCDPHDRPPRLS